MIWGACPRCNHRTKGSSAILILNGNILCVGFHRKISKVWDNNDYKCALIFIENPLQKGQSQSEEKLSITFIFVHSPIFTIPSDLHSFIEFQFHSTILTLYVSWLKFDQRLYAFLSNILQNFMHARKFTRVEFPPATHDEARRAQKVSQLSHSKCVENNLIHSGVYCLAVQIRATKSTLDRLPSWTQSSRTWASTSSWFQIESHRQQKIAEHPKNTLEATDEEKKKQELGSSAKGERIQLITFKRAR